MPRRQLVQRMLMWITPTSQRWAIDESYLHFTAFQAKIQFIDQLQITIPFLPDIPMGSTLKNLWSPTFAAQPAVFIPDGPEVTYAQLEQQIEAVTAALRDGGVQPGEPIGIVLGNNLEFLVAFLATTWARAIAAPLNPGYKV